ncbi:MAG: Ada metal-binding domain-containing protein [Patescibacteria group bacterium]
MRTYKIWKNGGVVQSPYPALYAGITTMKIFGRLSCKSGMRAKKKNRIFFHFWEDAVEAGFRPCKNCKPEKFSRADCDHMPFGLTGGLALAVKQTKRGKIRITCELCGKFLGYATKDGHDRVKWHDGFVIPRKEFEKILG